MITVAELAVARHHLSLAADNIRAANKLLAPHAQDDTIYGILALLSTHFVLLPARMLDILLIDSRKDT